MPLYTCIVATIGFAFIVLFTREVIAPASNSSCDKRWLRMAGAVNLGQMLAAVSIGFCLLVASPASQVAHAVAPHSPAAPQPVPH